MKNMTDDQVVCLFMEPVPEPRPAASFTPVAVSWWKWRYQCVSKIFIPCPNDDMYESLDSLRLVEAKLSPEQRRRYTGVLVGHGLLTFDLLHCSATEKLKALATVLRSKEEQE